MDQSSQGNYSSRIGPSDVYSSSFMTIPNFGLVQQNKLNLCLLPQGYSLAPMPGFGYQVPQMFSLNIPVVPTILIPCSMPTEKEKYVLPESATQGEYSFSPGTSVNLSSTVNQLRTDGGVTTSEIVGGSSQKQKDGSISPMPVITQELTETQKQNDVNIDITSRKNSTETVQQKNDDIISSPFNIKQELIEDQEQESSIVIPTTSKEPCVAPEKRNDDKILPTSDVIPKLAGAQGQNGLDLEQPLRVSFTSHQLMVLEEEFRMHRYPSKMKRVELSSRLQLSEKQVSIWFQNKRARCKKSSSRVEQNQEITEKQKNIHHSAMTEEILNETSLKEEDVSISSITSINRELTDTYNQQNEDNNTREYSIEPMQEKIDSVFSSVHSVKQELTGDQEPNNCDVIPTLAPHSFVITDVRSISPTSSINTGLIEAEEQNGTGKSNLSGNVDLTKRFRTIFTRQQLEVLKSEFDLNQFLSWERRSEISKKLQLPEKQVKLWFQNQRRVRKKVGSTISQKS